MIMRYRSVTAVVLWLLLLSFVPTRSGFSQTATSKIAGRVESSESTRGFRVSLIEDLTGSTIQSTDVSDSGTFILQDVPFGSYQLTLTSQTDTLARRSIVVSSSVPMEIQLTAARRVQGDPVTVEASASGIDRVGPRTVHTAEKLERLPVPSVGKMIEEALLNTPGVVPDEDGRMHVRGEEAQLQYVIDGIPVMANLTRVYSNLLNGTLIKSMDFLRGGFNAEYGVATSGVAVVTTKSGFDQPFFGRGLMTMGSFGLSEKQAELGGNLGGRVAYYANYGSYHSSRYMDPKSGFEASHVGGGYANTFAKLNALISNNFDLAAIFNYNSGGYDVPNSTDSSKQDQHQDLKDYTGGLRLNYGVSSNSILTLIGYARHATSALRSGGLREITDSASRAKAIAQNDNLFLAADRTQTNYGGQLEYALRADWFGAQNEFKAGAGMEIIPLEEYFSLGVTDSTVEDEALQQFDLTRGRNAFAVTEKKTGRRISGFFQDIIKSGRWTYSLGARVDQYSIFGDELHLSPRVGAAYAVNPDLVIRGSYNRLVMMQPLEYLLTSSSDAAVHLTDIQGTIANKVKPEKSHVFELGAGYRANEYVNFDLSGYGKLINDYLVKSEISSSGVIFPMNLREGFAVGGELEVRLNRWNDFSGNLTFSAGVAKGFVPEDGSHPISAGLIIGEEGEAYSNPWKGEDAFPTEHSQLMAASFALTYSPADWFFTTLGGRFDSGLPFDLAENGVGVDPDRARVILRGRGYSDDVIDLLNLESEEPGSPDKSVAARMLFNLSAGIDIQKLAGYPIKLVGSIYNILDTKYLYKFESSFGGTHFGQPRTFVLRIELAG